MTYALNCTCSSSRRLVAYAENWVDAPSTVQTASLTFTSITTTLTIAVTALALRNWSQGLTRPTGWRSGSWNSWGRATWARS